VVEEHFGVKVADPYRWMERAESAAELSAWMGAEGDKARVALDAIPGRAKLLARTLETGLGDAGISMLARVGDLAFYRKVDKGGVARKLVVRRKGGEERVLFDPAAHPTADGHHTSIDHFTPSPDGKRVAFGLAAGGGEITTEHVMDVATGAELPDAVEHIWGEFAVSWLPDGTGFFYTQMAPEAFTDPHVDRLKNMRLSFHHLGDPVTKDVVLLRAGVNPSVPLEPQEFPGAVVNPASEWVLGVVGGAQNVVRVFLVRLADLRAKGASAPWVKVAGYEDGVEAAVIHGDALYLQSHKDAPNKRVLRVPLKAPSLAAATVVVPEGEAVVEQIAGPADALYVTEEKDGRSALRRVSYRDGRTTDVKLPFDGWVDTLAIDARRPGALVTMEGWVVEPSLYALDGKSAAFTKLEWVPKGNADFSSIVSEEVTVPAADGALVPLSILRRKDLVLDGSHPTVLVGYGAYGISRTPQYLPFLLAWLERGGIWANAHVRGGGEKGERWRLAGSRENKPNSWRDFNACGEWLAAKKYTSPAKLGAYSASMGGILIGRAITERPDLYAAAAIGVGELNTTRYLEGTNGANQSQELGTPDTAAGFNSLLEMDAYQHLKDGVAYPAVLLVTGLNDSRVAPWMSAKFGARLQVATSSGHPVLLRVAKDEGHGVGSTREQRLVEWADMWSFFLQQMGDPEFASSK
jgi:prolyl oligopeptidase